MRKMKINLTKLLEIPARVKRIQQDNQKDSTSTFSGINSEVTSANRVYSFELEEMETGG